MACTTHDFQSCTFDHSVTSPEGRSFLAPIEGLGKLASLKNQMSWVEADLMRIRFSKEAGFPISKTDRTRRGAERVVFDCDVGTAAKRDPLVPAPHTIGYQDPPMTLDHLAGLRRKMCLAN